MWCADSHDVVRHRSVDWYQADWLALPHALLLVNQVCVSSSSPVFWVIWCLMSREANTITSVHVDTLPQYAERLVNTEPVDAGLPQSLYTLLA